MRYMLAKKIDKPKVARDVVRMWRQLKPPGRFLDRLDNRKWGPVSIMDSHNIWYDVGNKKAQEKASQCLRELTTDAFSIIHTLSHKDISILNIPSPPTERDMPPPIPNFPTDYTTQPAAAASASIPKMALLSRPDTASHLCPLPMLPMVPAQPLPHSYAAAPTMCISPPFTPATLPYSTSSTLSYGNMIQGSLDVSKMSELEYQQYMLMIQHRLVQVQVEIQCLHQTIHNAREQRKEHGNSKAIVVTRKQLK
jgi:hypothetical protein